MRIISYFVLLTAVILPVWADEQKKLPPEILETLLLDLKDAEFTQIKPSDIHISPLAEPNQYESVVGPYLFRIMSDSGFVFSEYHYLFDQGDLSDAERARIRKNSLKLLSEKRMIIFAPKEKARKTITVFTDASCPFCAKLHGEIDALNAAGVKIRYLGFPRDGLDSPGHEKTSSVWCSENQKQALTDAVADKPVKPLTCNNPVAAYFNLGESIGVEGTPAIVYENGELAIGYQSAEAILKRLKLVKNK
ncbi:MAG: thioredoxin fold domain-containing protein [Gammaproteobacteria bacterium]|nr:thioredoxin fold domain-containing protein [Gammaproteobacteria bacterium]